MSMNVFDNSEFEAQREKYAKEAKERWGGTAAYKENTKKTAGYDKDKWKEVNGGMDEIIGEFAECMKSGAKPDHPSAQALVKKWQDFISTNHYTCTKEILAGLGEMYTADGRFMENIDRHGSGTAAFMSEAIKFFCG